MFSFSTSSAAHQFHFTQSFFSSLPKKQNLFNSLSFKKPTNSPSFFCLKIGVQEIAELAHNKVLVAAAVSSATGQFSKPFTSALYGRGVDFRAAIRSGGMPSTHSAGVVAAATSLGLERGFSDSVFGMSVVFAAIVMYDAQGVRREVGYQAKVLNKILLRANEKPAPFRENVDSIESKSGTSSATSESLAPLHSLSEKGLSYMKNPASPLVCRSENVTSKPNAFPPSSAVDGEEMLRPAYNNYVPLKEYVGHTEIEVLVGALLGLLVSLAVDLIL